MNEEQGNNWQPALLIHGNCPNNHDCSIAAHAGKIVRVREWGITTDCTVQIHPEDVALLSLPMDDGELWGICRESIRTD